MSTSSTHIVCLSLTLLLSVSVNIALGTKVRVQRVRIAYLTSPKPVEGTRVPALEVKGVDGHAELVFFSRPTVLYVFSPTCHWCARNLRNIKALYGAVGGRFRVVGIALSGQKLSSYLANTTLPFEVYAEPTEAAEIAYKFAATPETWVVGSGGVVMKRWAGAWTGDNQKEIERYFGLSLPGLSDEQASVH